MLDEHIWRWKTFIQRAFISSMTIIKLINMLGGRKFGAVNFSLLFSRFIAHREPLGNGKA